MANKTEKQTQKVCQGCNVAAALEKKHDTDVAKFKDDIKCEVAKEVGAVVDKRLEAMEKILVDDHNKMQEIYPRIEKDIKLGKSVQFIFQYVKELDASTWIKGITFLFVIIMGLGIAVKFVIGYLASIKLLP